MTRATARFAVLLALLLASAGAAAAQSVLAARTIPAQTVIRPGDLRLAPETVPGALVSLEEALGLETVTTLYAGRPVAAHDLGAPTLVDRNTIVKLVFDSAALWIETEGRVLDRGSLGDRVRVMNLSSRTIVTGEVIENGTIRVGK